MIKGNSTMACPDAIFNPTNDPYLLPYRRLIKKRGPGDKTPEVETSITWSENSIGDIIPFIHPKVHSNIIIMNALLTRWKKFILYI